MHSRRPTLPPEPAAGGSAASPRSRWAALSALWPYLWEYRWRVGVALLMLVAAKVANVGVPVVLKDIETILGGA